MMVWNIFAWCAGLRFPPRVSQATGRAELRPDVYPLPQAPSDPTDASPIFVGPLGAEHPQE